VTDSTLAREVVADDEASVTAAFIAFLETASAKRHPSGVMRRFNQARAAGCVHAEFSVRADIPADCRTGLFSAPGTYAARMRFAHATSSSDRERDVRGLSIAVDDVPGENLTPGSQRQDFVLNSHPVMMVAGTREFLELLQAAEAGGFRRALYFLTHPGAARIAMASRQHHSSPLEIPYWSTTPYLFGPGRAVKYMVKPATAARRRLPSPLTDRYLHDAMASQLAQGDAEFEFLIQFQTDAEAMPIEDASVEWSAARSPWQPVARIRVPQQSVADPETDQACEAMSFNPWNALAEHRPLGSFNRARREIYHAMSRFRQRAHA
jgi:hypothetical protein